MDLEYAVVGQTKLNTQLDQFASQIQDREQARITRRTNEQKVTQFLGEQELKSTEALTEQRQMVIDVNTNHVLAKVSVALGEIFASDDSDFAKLFSAYMTPVPLKGAPSPLRVTSLLKKSVQQQKADHAEQ